MQTQFIQEIIDYTPFYYTRCFRFSKKELSHTNIFLLLAQMLEIGEILNMIYLIEKHKSIRQKYSDKATLC